MKQTFIFLKGEELNFRAPSKIFEELDTNTESHAADTTYFYIQKPQNLELQRLTYNSYKHRNLVKVLAIVTSDSYFEFISQTMGGRLSDPKCWEMSKVEEKLELHGQNSGAEKILLNFDKGMGVEMDEEQKYEAYDFFYLSLLKKKLRLRERKLQNKKIEVFK